MIGQIKTRHVITNTNKNATFSPPGGAWSRVKKQP